MASRLHVIYAGRGDAMIIEEDNRLYLLDGGPKGHSHGNDGAPYYRYLMTALRETAAAMGRQAVTPDAVIVSHAHEDHFGGIEKLFERFLTASATAPASEAKPLAFNGPFVTQLLGDAEIDQADLKKVLQDRGFVKRQPPTNGPDPYAFLNASFLFEKRSGVIQYEIYRRVPVMLQTAWDVDKSPDNLASVLMFHPATRAVYTGDSVGYLVVPFVRGCLGTLAQDQRELALFKVPHHGSLRNTQRDRLAATVPPEAWQGYGLLWLLSDGAVPEPPGIEWRRSWSSDEYAKRVIEKVCDKARQDAGTLRTTLQNAHTQTLQAIAAAAAPTTAQFAAYTANVGIISRIWARFASTLKDATSFDVLAAPPDRDTPRYATRRTSIGTILETEWVNSVLSSDALKDIYVSSLARRQIELFFGSFAAKNYVISADKSYSHPAVETLAGIAAASARLMQQDNTRPRARVFVTDAHSADLYRLAQLRPQWAQEIELRYLDRRDRIVLDLTQPANPDTQNTTRELTDQVDAETIHKAFQKNEAALIPDRSLGTDSYTIRAASGSTQYLHIDDQGAVGLSTNEQRFQLREAWELGQAGSFDEIILTPLQTADSVRVKLTSGHLGFLIQIRDTGFGPPRFTATDRFLCGDASFGPANAAAQFQFTRVIPVNAAAAVALSHAVGDTAQTLRAFYTQSGAQPAAGTTPRQALAALVGPDDAAALLAQIRLRVMRRVLDWAVDLDASTVLFERDARGLTVGAATLVITLGAPLTFTIDDETATIATARATLTGASGLKFVAAITSDDGITLSDDADVATPSYSRALDQYLADVGMDAAQRPLLTVAHLLVGVIGSMQAAQALLASAPTFLISAGLGELLVDHDGSSVTTQRTVTGTTEVIRAHIATVGSSAQLTVDRLSLTLSGVTLEFADARLPSMSVGVRALARTSAGTNLTLSGVLGSDDTRFELLLADGARLGDVAAIVLGAAGEAALAALMVPLAQRTIGNLSLTRPRIGIRQATAGAAAYSLAEVSGSVDATAWNNALPDGWPTVPFTSVDLTIFNPSSAEDRSVGFTARKRFSVGQKTAEIELSAWPLRPSGDALAEWAYGARISAAAGSDACTVPELLGALALTAPLGKIAADLPVIGGLVDRLAINDLRVSLVFPASGLPTWDEVTVDVALNSAWSVIDGVLEIERGAVRLDFDNGRWSGEASGAILLANRWLLGFGYRLPQANLPGSLSIESPDGDLTLPALLTALGLGALGDVPLLGTLLDIGVEAVELTLAQGAGATVTVAAVECDLLPGARVLGALNLDALAVNVRRELTAGGVTTVKVEATWGNTILNIVYDGHKAELAAALRTTTDETLADLLARVPGNLPANVLLPLIGALKVREAELVLGTDAMAVTMFRIRLEGTLAETNHPTNSIGELELAYTAATATTPRTYQLHGTLQGTGSQAAVKIDCIADAAGDATVSASIVPLEHGSLTLRGLLALLGIGEPPIAKPEGTTAEVFDAAIDGVSAKLAITAAGWTVAELDAAGHLTGTAGLVLLDTPHIELTALGAKIHYTPAATTGFLIGQLAIGPALVTVAYDGAQFVGTVTPASADRPDYATLLNTPPFAPGYGLPTVPATPASIPLDTVTVTARKGDFVDVVGAGSVNWSFSVAGIDAAVTGLGGRIRVAAGQSQQPASYACTLLGTFAFTGFAGAAAGARVSFGSGQHTILSTAAGAGVSLSVLADTLSPAGQGWSATVPEGSARQALANASQAFAYVDATDGLLAVYGSLSGYGNVALLSRRVGDKRGFVFACGLSEGFRLGDLWSALAPVDGVIGLRRASASAVNWPAKFSDLEADLAIVSSAARAMGAAFIIDLPALPDAEAAVPAGMSLYAELNPGTGTLTSNLGAIAGNPTVIVSATIDATTPANTVFRGSVSNLSLIGGALTLHGEVSYRPAAASLEIAGGMRLVVGTDHYDFAGAFMITPTLGTFALDQNGAAVNIMAPFGMKGIALRNAHLRAEYGFGNAASPTVVQVGGTVTVDVLELQGLLLWSGSAPKVVAVTLAHSLSLEKFVTNVLGAPWPVGFDPVELESGTISYADAGGNATITVDGVTYPAGYHVSTAVTLLGTSLTVDVGVPATGSGVALSGRYVGSVDLYLAKITDPVLSIDTTAATTKYEAAFGVTIFGKAFVQTTLAYQPNSDAAQRRYLGSAQYRGALLGIDNPSVKLSYTKAGGLRLEEWPALLDITAYLDVAKELYEATRSNDPCGALIDLLFDQGVTTKSTLKLNQDTGASTADGLPIVVGGTWAVSVGSEKIFELPLPDLHGVIPAPSSFSADGLAAWIGSVIQQNGLRIAQDLLRDTAEDRTALTALAAKLAVDRLARDVVRSLLCHGAETYPLLERAWRDARRPPPGPDGPKDPPTPPPTGVPVPISFFPLEIADAVGVIASLAAFLLSIAALFSEAARRKKQDAEDEKERQEQRKRDAEDRLRAALTMRGQPTLAFAADGTLTVAWTADNRPAQSGINYEGYGGVTYEVQVRDEDGRLISATTSGWSISIAAADLARSPVASVQMRAVYQGMAGAYTTAAAARHLATLAPPASVAARYDAQTDAVIVTVAPVPHATSYAIELAAGALVAANATVPAANGNSASFPVTDLPAGLPAGTTLLARARAVGDGTTRRDSSVTAAPSSLPVVAAPLPALVAAGDSAVLTWTGMAASTVPPYRVLDGTGRPLTPPATTSPATVRFSLDEYPKGMVFGVQLRAIGGIATWSAAAQLTVNRLATPQSFDAVYRAPENALYLTWLPVDGAAGYEVEAHNAQGAALQVGIALDPTGTGAIVSGAAIANGSEYRLRVCATGGFPSLWTEALAVTAELIPAPGLPTITIVNGAVQAAWPNQAARSYLVTLSQGATTLSQQWTETPLFIRPADATPYLQSDSEFAVSVRARIRGSLSPAATATANFPGVLTLATTAHTDGLAAPAAAAVVIGAMPHIGPVRLLATLAAAGYPANTARDATAAQRPETPPASLDGVVANLARPKQLVDLLAPEQVPTDDVKALLDRLVTGPEVLRVVAFKLSGMTRVAVVPLLDAPAARDIVPAVFDDPAPLGRLLKAAQIAATAAVQAFRDAYPDLALSPVVASLRDGGYSVTDPVLAHALAAAYPVGIAVYADALGRGLAAATLVQALVLFGAAAPDALAQLLRVQAGIFLTDAGKAWLAGLKAAGKPVDPLAAQQAFVRVVGEALRQDPLRVKPGSPQVTGGTPTWAVPLFDPATSPLAIAVVGQRSGRPTVVANTGSWLNFIDATTGEVRAVVDGGVWDVFMTARDDVVYACDAMAGQLSALRPDGTQIWRVPLPGDQWAVADTVVVAQNTQTGALAALDRATGEHRWTAAGSGRVVYSGMAAGKGLVFYKTGTGPGVAGVQAIDERTGQPGWSATTLANSDGTWIPDSGLDVINGMLVCTVHPYVWFFDAATGQAYRSGRPFLEWSQGPGPYKWGATPFASSLFFGVAHGIGYLVDPANSSTPTPCFPSLQEARAGRPNPNDWGLPQPLQVGGALILAMQAEEQAQIIQSPGRLGAFDLPWSQVFGIAGQMTAVTAGATALYSFHMPLGADKVAGVWLISLPLAAVPGVVPAQPGPPTLAFQAVADPATSVVTATWPTVQGASYAVHAALGDGPLRPIASVAEPKQLLTADLLGGALTNGTVVRVAVQTTVGTSASPVGAEARLTLAVLPAPTNLTPGYSNGALTLTWTVDPRASTVNWVLTDAAAHTLASTLAAAPPLRWLRSPTIPLRAGEQYVITGNAQAGANAGLSVTVHWTVPSPDQLAASEYAAGRPAADAAAAVVSLQPGMAFADLLGVLARATYPAVQSAPASHTVVPGANATDIAHALVASYAGIGEPTLIAALQACGFSTADVQSAVGAVLGRPLAMWMGVYDTNPGGSSAYSGLRVGGDGTVSVGNRQVASTYDTLGARLSWEWQPTPGAQATVQIAFSGQDRQRSFTGTANPQPAGSPMGYAGTLARDVPMWPSALNGPSNTGRSLLRGPTEPTVAWQTAIGGQMRGGPAVDAAGLLYVGGDDSRLYCLRPDGSILWRFVSTYPVYATPAIAEGVIYTGSDGLIAVGADGAARWRVDRRDIGMIVTLPPKLSYDGTTVYVLAASSTGRGDRLLAIDVAGARQKWEFVIPGSHSNAGCGIGPDGTIYLGSETRALYALDPATGQPRWTYQDPTPQGWIRGPAVIDPQGAVYYARSTQNPAANAVVCLNPGGTRRWEYAGGQYLGNPPSIAVGHDGTVFAGFYGMHAITPAGQRKWATPTPNNQGIYPGAACVDRDGTVYFGAAGGLYAYSANGSLLWHHPAGGSNSAPALAGDGALAFANGNTVIMLKA